MFLPLDLRKPVGNQRFRPPGPPGRLLPSGSGLTGPVSAPGPLAQGNPGSGQTGRERTQGLATPALRRFRL